MTINIIKYLFLFASGAIIGWCIEVVYRRYSSVDKKWVNPGFLSGPYLPLYGTGTCIMYIVSESAIPLYLKIIIFFFAMTFVELITGLFFLKYYNIRLWDYSSRFLNYKGLICPLFSFFWTVLGLFFYFVMYPFFYSKITMIYNNLELSLFIGIFYGIFIVDLAHNIEVAERIKKIIEIAERQIPVHFEQLKQEIRHRRKRLTLSLKPSFFNPFRGIDLQDYIPHLKKTNNQSNEQDKEKDNIT